MKSETNIQSCPVRIDRDLDSVIIGVDASTSYSWHFSRANAPELIEFMQQWLDHDPEQELIDEVYRIRIGGPDDDTELTKAIIFSVREHDAKYGKP